MGYCINNESVSLNSLQIKASKLFCKSHYTAATVDQVVMCKSSQGSSLKIKYKVKSAHRQHALLYMRKSNIIVINYYYFTSDWH